MGITVNEMLINGQMEKYLNEKLDPKIGYCAAIHESEPTDYIAYMYMWGNTFSDYEMLAQLFFEAGAFNVSIVKVMHSDSKYSNGNNDRNGFTENGDIALEVRYHDNPFD